MRPAPKVVVTGIIVLAVAALAGLPFVGMERLSLANVFGAPDSTGHLIFWRLRVPRVLAAFLAGSGLATSGMALQALFRNPLATPYTLGVSSGSAFGAAVFVVAGWSFSCAGLSGESLCAFAGALLSLGFVFGLTQRRRGLDTATLLLAGVAVGFFFSALLLFLQYLSDFTQTVRMIRWLMGGFDSVGYDDCLGLLPFVIVGGAVVFGYARELTLLLTGEALAASRGVEVARVKVAVLLATSFSVAGVVAVCGPIGFVGMIVPHVCRMLVGSSLPRLAPVTLLAGGAFLALCDTAARTILAPAELPVGILTALLGGPFFLWQLLRLDQRRRLVV